MDEKERKKLVEKRKRELRQKEFELDIKRDLDLEFRKSEQEEIRGEYRNKYVDRAILFLGTLIPAYLLLFGIKFLFTYLYGGMLVLAGIQLNWFDPLFHILAWAAALYSLYKKQSVFDLFV